MAAADLVPGRETDRDGEEEKGGEREERELTTNNHNVFLSLQRRTLQLLATARGHVARSLSHMPFLEFRNGGGTKNDK